MQSPSPLLRAALVAGIFIGLVALSRALVPEHLSAEWSARLVGALMGLLVVGYANVIPKWLTPLDRMRCPPGVEQSIRRFIAWSLVLGGLAFSLTWLLAPLQRAPMWSVAVLGLSLCVSAIRILFASRESA